MAKRKRYTEEFKREAVRLLVTRGDQPAAEVAKGLGVSGEFARDGGWTTLRRVE